MHHNMALQFRIELQDIKPSIWRLIDIPSTYSFWDLHVTIQDSMGWLDYHLHTFSIRTPGKTPPIIIGTPDNEFGETTLPGWEIPVSQYFVQLGDEAVYDYDFGDGWRHTITLTGTFLRTDGIKYPRCTDGQRQCPPEDCGGVPGYDKLINIVRDIAHEEHEEMVSWLMHHPKNYLSYNPEYFKAQDVIFTDPSKRWKLAIQT